MPCSTCMKLRRQAADAVKQGDVAKVATVGVKAAGHSLSEVMKKLKGERR